MVSTELLLEVAALPEGDRVELLGYIESTLAGGVVPTPEQQLLASQRDAELVANPEIGLTKDEAIAAVLALRA